jgi:membrane protease YdiL (CAAX protease family)
MILTLTCLVLSLAGPLVLALAGARLMRDPPSLAAHMTGLMLILTLTSAVLFVAIAGEGRPPVSLGLKPVTGAAVIQGLALGAFFVFILGPVLMRLPGWLRLKGFEGGIAVLARLPLWTIVLAILAVAPAEEILYRGYALPALTDVTGSLWLAAIVSIIAFALAHVPVWGWGPSSILIIPAAMMTAFYIWLEDLTPLILAHVLTDLAGLTLPRVYRTG